MFISKDKLEGIISRIYRLERTNKVRDREEDLKIAKDETLPKSERVAAMRRITQLFPSYFMYEDITEEGVRFRLSNARADIIIIDVPNIKKKK